MTTENKVFIGIGLLTLFILVGGVFFMNARDKKQEEKLIKPLMGEEITIQESPHVTGKDHEPYNSNPPTSGPMWNDTAGPGVKDENVADEIVVHSMEHGAAVVWYKADLPKEDVEKITQAFNDVGGKKILIPRKDLDTLVALTSWGRLLKLDSVDKGKIKEFIATNENRGPEKMAI